MTFNKASLAPSSASDRSGASHGRPLLLIGAGRLASHLSHYFDLLQVRHLRWDRRRSEEELRSHLTQNPLALLAISDKSLGDFYRLRLEPHGIQTVHFSGASEIQGVMSCHPLMTFGPELYDLKTYQSLYFAVCGASRLQDVIPPLLNPSFEIRTDQKALYHALCVLSAAGAQSLWLQALRGFQYMNLPSEALLPYFQQIGSNFSRHGEEALTGPWVRDDLITIEKNREALRLYSEKLNMTYQELKEGLYDNP
jgi:hypothetical protein